MNINMCTIMSSVFTCAGTTSPTSLGIFLGSRRILTIERTDPDSTFEKKMFHTVNHNSLVHALFFIWLGEIYPCMEEKSIIMGGTIEKNNRRMRLGSYPVIKSLTNVLKFKNQTFSTMLWIDKSVSISTRSSGYS